MARLIYSTISSLDGCTADRDGTFDWAAPDEEVHAFVNDLERPIGTYLYGRRLYEVMVAWADPALLDHERAVMRDFAELWQAADKVVYSSTLGEVSSPRTRIERHFEPDTVRRLVLAADRDVSIGGPTLAAHAIRAGLVDECHQFLTPVVVGGGLPTFPDDVRWPLELVAERRFTSGVVHLHHRTRT